MSSTYTNPVYPGYFADPFVFGVKGTYYAYGTGSLVDGRAFEVLRSENLTDWESIGGALEPLGSQFTDYWAPEVAEEDGVFYMYFSAGAEEHLLQQLRVAVASDPAGPFRSDGTLLTGDDPFSIDAHPFRDDDGTWYLYYARDFLEGDRVGTALVVDRLDNMKELRGERVTALRASSDWQLFQAGRKVYGGVYDWHTVEGPFVKKRSGKYYLFYSGGSFQNDTYGVSYAVADRPLGPFEEPEGDGPAILRSVPGEVIGPGHNSIVEGPDGHDYIVYHAWDPDMTARRMCIDRLEWGPEGPRCSGATSSPQPAPR
jgi:GH43 family beta-xylosidase